ncbi:LacI family DNA-binding transcriptional regulator [Pelagicoccus enzymogenes]|uniref:LacI family DNA-binding transcriptional regulator n=1 Tax=Pelagicoccus enzymogenes TaxID=2773457 RepID=UPI00280EC962|nr:LacI family DNA-binding transcriptional regulator [Pelagicoccus enzymogenes]MDQ8199393.1 LacI family DNA-binding transcriptional regulator [Pelagicoccus enzymogenes]
MITLKDIAKAAGVSAGTVSFVLNGTYKKRRISSATVDRVQGIAREMGYMPNIAARNLRSKDPSNRPIVLAIVTSADSPLALVGHLLDALKLETNENPALDFQINIAMFSPGQLSELPGLLDGSRFNAAFIANTSREDDAFLSKIKLPYPVVLVGREIEGYSCFMPSKNAGRVAFRALKNAGAKKLGVIHPSELTQATAKRVEMFCSLAEKELGESVARIVCSDQSESAATRAFATFLKKGQLIEGLFAVHDTLAAGAYLAMRGVGLRIPTDVRVMGIGDGEWAPYLEPPLSCSGAEDRRVYQRAVKMMLEDLRSEEPKPRFESTNAKFIDRGSV